MEGCVAAQNSADFLPHRVVTAILRRDENNVPVREDEGYKFTYLDGDNSDLNFFCDVDINNPAQYLSVNFGDGVLTKLLFTDEGDDAREENDRWDNDSTKLLLSLYEHYLKVLKDRKIKTKSKMWLKIEEDMKAKSYGFTSKQIENRFKTLERRYKNLLTNNNSSGRSRKTMPFQAELDGIFQKDPRIFPEALATTSSILIQNEYHSLVEASSTSSSNKNDETACNSLKQKDERKRRNIDVLLAIKEELQKRTEQKEIDRKRKLELTEERNVLLREKNRLLREYLELKKQN